MQTPERRGAQSRELVRASMLDGEAATSPAASPRLGAAVGRPLAPPSSMGGWLWRLDEGSARWARLWCMLQGHALLCYSETHSAADPAAVGGGEAGGVGAVGGLLVAVPLGVDLERPVRRDHSLLMISARFTYDGGHFFHRCWPSGRTARASPAHRTLWRRHRSMSSRCSRRAGGATASARIQRHS
jgi:hypothetical protein